MQSRVFGSILRDWNEHRGVRPSVKLSAIVVVALVVGGTIAFSSLPPLALIAIAVVAMIGLTVVARLPTIANDPATARTRLFDADRLTASVED